MKLKQLITSALITGALLYAASSANAAAIPTDFDAVPAYAKSTIQDMYAKNLMTGFQDGTFQPQKQLTRAEFFAMLLRVVDAEEIRASETYAETMTKFERDVIDQAYKAGLIDGAGELDGKIVMNPRATITRQEIATVLFNAYQQQVYTHPESSDVKSTLAKFSDRLSIPKWSEYALAKAVDLQLLNGTSLTTLSPQKTATRTEAAVLVYRFLKKLEAMPTKIEVGATQTIEQFYEEQRHYIIMEKNQNKPFVRFYERQTIEQPLFKHAFPDNREYALLFSINGMTIDAGYIQYTVQGKSQLVKVVMETNTVSDKNSYELVRSHYNNSLELIVNPEGDVQQVMTAFLENIKAQSAFTWYTEVRVAEMTAFHENVYAISFNTKDRALNVLPVVMQ